MGTKGLIAVKVDNEFKVAQYCQFDSYPEGQGSGVLGFLLRHRHVTGLKDIFARVRYLSDEDLEEIQKKIDSEKINNWKNIWPELSTTTGSDVLWDIVSRAGEIQLKNDLAFSADSISCEYIYVIDFDERLFSVYSKTVYNKDIHSHRESHFKDINGYKYGELVTSEHTRLIDFDLDKLPTLDDFVLKTLSVMSFIGARDEVFEADCESSEGDKGLPDGKLFSNTVISLTLPVRPSEIESLVINGIEYVDFRATDLETFRLEIKKEN